jgi:molecular chaperone GrpE
VPALEEKIAQLEAERDEHVNDLKRVAADFENYRKREVPPTERARQLSEGVRLVHRALKDALKREGLAEIETNGRFDPHVHEALLSQPSDAEEGSVIEVVQKGYQLGDRVVRPARVVVAAPQESDGDR